MIVNFNNIDLEIEKFNLCSNCYFNTTSKIQFCVYMGISCFIDDQIYVSTHQCSEIFTL